MDSNEQSTFLTQTIDYLASEKILKKNEEITLEIAENYMHRMSKDTDLFYDVLKKMEQLFDQCYALESRTADTSDQLLQAIEESNEWLHSKAKEAEQETLRIYPSGIIKGYDEEEQQVVVATLPEQLPRNDQLVMF